MAISPALHFPLLSEGQTAKEATVNTALLRFEAATQKSLALNGATGNLTLTNAQSVSYGRYAVSGNTASISVTIPQIYTDSVAIERIFLFHNKSAYTINILGSVSGSAAVPANFAALVYVNGTVVELIRLATDVPQVALLGDIGDVDLSTPPENQQALLWDITEEKWVPGDVSTGGSSLYLNDLNDVEVVLPTDGQVLKYDDATGKWKPGTDLTGGGGGGGISDAPVDGTKYVRKDAGWVAETTGGGGGITDAPVDGVAYNRKDGAWVADAGGGGGGGIPEAPSDGLRYARTSASWVAFEDSSGNPVSLTFFGDRTTFGSDNLVFNGYIQVTKVLVPTGAKLRSGAFRTGSGAIAGTVHARMIAFADSAGSPGARVAQSALVAGPWAANTSVVIPFTAEYTGTGGYVWIGIVFDATLNIASRSGGDKYWDNAGTTAPANAPSAGSISNAGSAWCLWGEGFAASTVVVGATNLDELTDVDTSTVAPTDGQALVFNNASGKWKPATISGGGGGSSAFTLFENLTGSAGTRVIDPFTAVPSNFAAVSGSGFTGLSGTIVDRADGVRTKAFQFPATPNSGRSAFRLNANVFPGTTGTIKVRVSRDSESNFDYFELLVDGVSVGDNRSVTTVVEITAPLSAGAHVLEFAYKKDGSGVIGLDTAWIHSIEYSTLVMPAIAIGDYATTSDGVYKARVANPTEAPISVTNASWLKISGLEKPVYDVGKLFGDRDTRGSTTTFNAYYQGMTRVLVPAGETLEKVCFATGGVIPNTTNVYGTVYTDVAGVPGVLIGKSLQITAAPWGSGESVELPLIAPYVGTGAYVWVGLLFNNNSQVLGRTGTDKYWYQGLAPADTAPTTTDLGSGWVIWADGKKKDAAASKVDYVGALPGVPAASAVILSTLMTRPVTFAKNFAGSFAVASVAPTNDTVLNIVRIRAGVSATIGTVTFLASSLSGTFNIGTQYVAAAGDVIEILAPSTIDATLSGVKIALAGIR